MRKSGYLLLLGLFFSPSAPADIYRCQGEDGEPSFRQSPCGENPVLVRLPASPVVTGRTKGLRPAERAWLEQRERGRQGAARQQRRKAAVAPVAGDRVTRAQAHRCRSKRRALDDVRSRLRRGYKPASGERLRRRRSAYEDYLATFCP